MPAKDYRTVTAGDVLVEDYLRLKVWDPVSKRTVFGFCRIVAISDGAASRWITLHHPFTGCGFRIRPRRTTQMQVQL